MKRTYIVTGGAGFIGSALVRHLAEQEDIRIVNVDSLTYAGNLASVASVADYPCYEFRKIDICDELEVRMLIEDVQPDGVFHLAAESHVDRSIESAGTFIKTNIVGTFNLLESVRNYWSQIEVDETKKRFRFLHVSTDEVYGSLGEDGSFVETTPYDPRSPYSSSKAAGDFLVSAWWHTYGLPVIVSNCSNNYGPHHFPEKLIPLIILRARQGLSLPIYGDGMNVRDWLYVDDHVRALQLILEKGTAGEKYNVGGRNERTNLEIVSTICAYLDEVEPKASGTYADQIEFVADRPGHDRRYAIDASKLERELGWSQQETFDSGIVKTIEWYRKNEDWWSALLPEAMRRHGKVK